METVRKPLQGVWNIVRFNWHFYVLAFLVLLLIYFSKQFLESSFHLYLDILFWGIITTTFISLAVSSYVYDFSKLYSLSWLDGLVADGKISFLNINAGFDETSVLLKDKYKKAELIVFDFYDPARHTEISIKRAREAYPPFPGTKQITTAHLPLENNSADFIFAILSAHEIRNDEERIIFFKELKRALKPGGKIIVTEHLRDLANLLAYNIGFLHFHSKKTWLKTFAEANLFVEKEIKITPFISTFILIKNGTAS